MCAAPRAGEDRDRPAPDRVLCPCRSRPIALIAWRQRRDDAGRCRRRPVDRGRRPDEDRPIACASTHARASARVRRTPAARCPAREHRRMAPPNAATGPCVRVRPFGATGLRLASLGLGTIWLGRPWPPNRPSYTMPDDAECDAFLRNAFAALGNDADGTGRSGDVMVDTAAAYGTCEARLGAWFAQHPDAFARTIVATKWGGSYERECAGQVAFSPTLASLRADFEQSVARLGRVDLLYSHLVSSIPAEQSIAALESAEITAELLQMRREHRGGLRLLGASISRADVLKAAIERDLLRHMDALQIPAWLYFEHPEWAEAAAVKGLAVVLNSPVRFKIDAADTDPVALIQQSICAPHVAMVLTGTRRHLVETIAAWRDCTAV